MPDAGDAPSGPECAAFSSSVGRWRIEDLKTPFRSALAIVSFGLCLPPGSVAGTMRLDPQPGFALSACWLSGGKVVIPEIQQGVLYLVDPVEETLERIARPGRGAKEFNRPAAVACSDDGLVLDDNGWHLVWLDRRLEATDGVFLPGHPVSDPATPVREGLEYLAVHDLIVHEGSVHVSGTFRLEGELYKGVGRISRRPLGVDLLHDHFHGNPRWTHFSAYQSFSLRTLASAGGTLYYLYFDRTPILLDVTSGEPVELPEPLRGALPSLLALDTRPLPERTGLLFSRVRQFRLPVGIWGWRGGLYLLSWRPGEAGLTWELWRRHEGGWRGPWALPISAPDLVVAPGLDAWAFVIKGARTEYDHQEVSAIETIPAARIEEALR